MSFFFRWVFKVFVISSLIFYYFFKNLCFSICTLSCKFFDWFVMNKIFKVYL